jgi:hypothetical protein
MKKYIITLPDLNKKATTNVRSGFFIEAKTLLA